jgi:hypothetical protein
MRVQRPKSGKLRLNLNDTCEGKITQGRQKTKKRVQRRAHDLKNKGADQRNRVQRIAHDLKNQDASLGSKPRSNSKIQFASKFVHVNLDLGP